MKTTSLLKVFVSETDKIGNTPLYELIVKKAHEKGLAGATVHRGILSFGASHSIHSVQTFSMTNQVPVVVEIIDEDENVRKFAEDARSLVDQSKKGALITIQNVEILEYKAGNKYNQFRSF